MLQAVVQQDRGTMGGALMHVEVSFVDLVIVICPRSAAATAAALKEIAALDPPSQGVPMRQVGRCLPASVEGSKQCLT